MLEAWWVGVSRRMAVFFPACEVCHKRGSGEDAAEAALRLGLVGGPAIGNGLMGGGTAINNTHKKTPALLTSIASQALWSRSGSPRWAQWTLLPCATQTLLMRAPAWRRSCGCAAQGLVAVGAVAGSAALPCRLCGGGTVHTCTLACPCPAGRHDALAVSLLSATVISVPTR